MKLSLDIETACAVEGCTDSRCSHAVDPYRNKITVIGVWNGTDGVTFRDLDEFKAFDEECKPSYIGFNLKFDLHTLKTKGIDIPLERWEEEVQLMATSYSRRVTDEYLKWYKEERERLNKLLPKGKGHREGKAYSLKVLAPWFLKVEPFWENTIDHNDDNYVLKDAKYTWDLAEVLEKALKEENSYEFYKEKLLKWNKLLYRMETYGVKIDIPLVEKIMTEKLEEAAALKEKLDEIWAPAYQQYRKLQQKELQDKYDGMRSAAQIKRKNRTRETDAAVADRYNAMYQKAAEKIPNKLNLNSTDQKTWLFRDYLGLDISDFDGDESTNKKVLKGLADREDIKTYLEYRAAYKLAVIDLPSYLEKQVDGVLHTSYKPYVPRTGRLSSAGPNLQNVSKGVHEVFIARPGHKMITKDEAAIEPRLVAYASDCPTLFEIFNSELDFHGYNAKLFCKLDTDINDIKAKHPVERDLSKEVGLSIIYGSGYKRLQESAQARGIQWDEQSCKERIWNFKDGYSTVYAYKESLDAIYRKGEVVKNLFGRPIRIANPQDIHLKGLNTLIQGSASDLVLHSAWRMQEEFDKKGIKAHVILAIHDELVVECPEDDVEEVDKIMEFCMTDYKLESKYGLIPLKTEGKVSDRWEK